MIKASIKPLDEIMANLEPYKRVLIAGCGGCVSICLAGGQREVMELGLELETALSNAGKQSVLSHYTAERQCNTAMFAGLEDFVDEVDCVLSLACGAGVQLLAETYPNRPVFPAVNTVAIGVDRDLGMYEEKCRACGECVLAYTGGVCPVTACAKGLFNGPCGGTNGTECEVGDDIPCAWVSIYTRLEEQDRLDNILKIQPVMQWKNQTRRVVVQPKFAVQE